MSWQSLSDVYSEQVLRNTSSTTMNNTQKDWRPLSEVYANNAQTGYLEEGKVQITLDNKTLPEFDLADIYVKEILQKARFHSVDLEKSIEDWVTSGGWGKKDKALIIEFLTRQINLLNNDIRGANYNIDDNVSFNLIKQQIGIILENKEKYIGFTKKLENKEFNYIDMLNEQAGDVFSKEFLKAVYEFGFKKTNVVTVGPGEVAATLFTEAKAADKGDLEVGRKLIELKKQGGIVGLADPGKDLLDYMSGFVDSNYIDQLRERELKNFNEYIESNKDLIQNAITLLKTEQEQKAEKRRSLNQEKKALLDLLQRLIGDEIAFTDIEKVKISPSLINKPEFNQLGDIKTIIDNIKDIKEGKVTKTSKLFFDMVSKNQLQGEYAVGLYLDSTNIKKDENILNIINQSNLEPLQKIGALAIVDYQIKDKFDYIFLTGPNYRTVVIGPFTNNISNNIKMVFNSIGGITFKMSGGRDTGKFEMFLGSPPAESNLQDPNIINKTITPQVPVPVDLNYSSDAGLSEIPAI